MRQEKRKQLEELADQIKGSALDEVYPAIKAARLVYGGTIARNREGQTNELYWSGSYEDYWGLNLLLEGGDREVIVDVEVYG